MKILASLSLFTLLLFSCGSKPTPEKMPPTVLETQVTGDENQTVANFHIDGVTCDGCRGKIKKELMEIDGVEAVEWSALEGDEFSRAVVNYDPALCNQEKMTEVVNTIVDGKYTVKKVEVVHMTTE